MPESKWEEEFLEAVHKLESYEDWKSFIHNLIQNERREAEVKIIEQWKDSLFKANNKLVELLEDRLNSLEEKKG